jgi:hypothetical protein
VGGHGEGLTPKFDSGRLVLELKPAPQYVALGKAAVK